MKALPQTERGRDTRDNILHTAAKLIHDQGAGGTGLADILEAAGAGKSQFYHYFDSKEGLVREVIRLQSDRFIEENLGYLKKLDTWAGIGAWFDALVERHRKRDCVGGCPIGSLASEMAEKDELLRKELNAAFADWQSYLARGLKTMKVRGELRRSADPDAMAEFTIAALEGGVLLARTQRSITPLKRTLKQVLSYLRSFSSRK